MKIVQNLLIIFGMFRFFFHNYFINYHIYRIRCIKFQSLVLADGEYYELVRSNFERADRQRVVRTTTSDQTSIVSLLNHYNELRFN